MKALREIGSILLACTGIGAAIFLALLAFAKPAGAQDARDYAETATVAFEPPLKIIEGDDGVLLHKLRAFFSDNRAADVALSITIEGKAHVMTVTGCAVGTGVVIERNANGAVKYEWFASDPQDAIPFRACDAWHKLLAARAARTTGV